MVLALHKIGLVDRPRLAAGCSLCVDELRTCGWLLRGECDRLRLNDTAAEILSRCNGMRSTEMLIEEMVALYAGSDPQEIASGVQAFLDSALAQGWIARE